jgi:hypothetical protein
MEQAPDRESVARIGKRIKVRDAALPAVHFRTANLILLEASRKYAAAGTPTTG